MTEEYSGLIARNTDLEQQLAAAHRALESMQVQLQEERRDKELYKATAFAAQNKVKLLWGENERLKVRLAEVHEI